MPLNKVEINCDMGEGFGRWKMGPDEELMDYIDVANIACGFHAGDPAIMLRTVRLAKAKGVRAGAHPGLQDLIGFGRRKIETDPEDVYASVLYQVGALSGILRAEGVALSHIKPHGELFFYMHRSAAIMRAVLRACRPFGVPVYGLGNELQSRICQELGIDFVPEFYPDIDYDAHAMLVPVAQSTVASAHDVYERVVRCASSDERESCEDGVVVRMGLGGKAGEREGGSGFSVCLHSDMPNALENVKAARRAVDEVNGSEKAAA